MARNYLTPEEQSRVVVPDECKGFLCHAFTQADYPEYLMWSCGICPQSKVVDEYHCKSKLHQQRLAWEHEQETVEATAPDLETKVNSMKEKMDLNYPWLMLKQDEWASLESYCYLCEKWAGEGEGHQYCRDGTKRHQSRLSWFLDTTDPKNVKEAENERNRWVAEIAGLDPRNLELHWRTMNKDLKGKLLGKLRAMGKIVPAYML